MFISAKNCVCVILEKIGYRKSSGEPLPKIGIMIDVDTEKIIGEVSEMDSVSSFVR